MTVPSYCETSPLLLQLAATADHTPSFSAVALNMYVPALGMSREMREKAEDTQSHYSGWMFPIKQLNQPPNDSFHRHLGNYRSLLFTSRDETAWVQPGWGAGVGGGWRRKPPQWEVSEYKQGDRDDKSEDEVEDVMNLIWLLSMALFGKRRIFLVHRQCSK